MYGVKVQEAVLKNREKYAGCTVHYVNAGIDTGEIIFQKEYTYKKMNRLGNWEESFQ